MASQTLSIELPSDILLILNESESDLMKRIKFLLSVHLYLTHKVTIGKAAQIADMSRFNFEALLFENKVPLSLLDFDVVLEDTQQLR